MDTAGKKDKVRAEYIKNQLKEDEMSEQLTLDIEDPFTAKKQKDASARPHYYAVKRSLKLSLLGQLRKTTRSADGYSLTQYPFRRTV